MTGRELLELAAKAAGLNFSWNDRLECGEVWQDGDRIKRFWQPHRDDGDALRLLVALKLSVTQIPAEDGDGPCVFLSDEKSRDLAWEEVEEESERLSAVCRAIVRAAAEIGRQTA